MQVLTHSEYMPIPSLPLPPHHAHTSTPIYGHAGKRVTPSKHMAITEKWSQCPSCLLDQWICISSPISLVGKWRCINSDSTANNYLSAGDETVGAVGLFWPDLFRPSSVSRPQRYSPLQIGLKNDRRNTQPWISPAMEEKKNESSGEKYYCMGETVGFVLSGSILLLGELNIPVGHEGIRYVVYI